MYQCSQYFKITNRLHLVRRSLAISLAAPDIVWKEEEGLLRTSTSDKQKITPEKIQFFGTTKVDLSYSFAGKPIPKKCEN